MRRSGDDPGAAAAVTVLPRLLLGAFMLSLPTFLVLIALVATDELTPAAALLAALAGYLGLAILFRPLLAGLYAVQAAVRIMAADENATPEVETLSPSIRELWLTVGRWARGMRMTLKTREAELSAARAVQAALPEPMLLLDAQRRIVRARSRRQHFAGPGCPVRKCGSRPQG